MARYFLCVFFFSFLRVNKSDVVLLQRALRNSNGVCCFYFKDPDCLNPRQIKTKNLDEQIWTMELGKVWQIVVVDGKLCFPELHFFRFCKVCKSFSHHRWKKHPEWKWQRVSRTLGREKRVVYNKLTLDELTSCWSTPRQGHSRSLYAQCEAQEPLMVLSSCFRWNNLSTGDKTSKNVLITKVWKFKGLTIIIFIIIFTISSDTCYYFLSWCCFHISSSSSHQFISRLLLFY